MNKPAAYPSSMPAQRSAMPMAMRVQQALGLHQQGKVAEAAAIYGDVLRTHPKQVECLHYLGVAMHQQGRHEEAIGWIQKAIQQARTNPTAYSNLGLAQHRLGKLQAALESYDKALALDRRFVDALNNRGLVLRDLGRRDDALKSYEAALAIQPSHLNTLANRGRLLLDMERAADALVAYDRLIAVRPAAEAWNGRGVALRMLKRGDEAMASFDRAIAADPACMDALNNKGNALSEAGDHRAAAVWFDRLVDLAPGSVAQRMKRMVKRLPIIAAEDDDIDAIRRRYADDLAAMRAWLATAPVSPRDGHDAVGSCWPFYLAYHARNNRDLIAPFGESCAELMAAWAGDNGLSCAPARAVGAKGTTGAEKIRVGIVSAHVTDHPVWTAILRGWFQRLDSARFELHVFHLGAREDAETRYAREQAAAFHSGAMNALGWARQITASQVDVLIYPELGMDALTTRLAALRLAPVQIASWGHPETSGLPTIDYYLSAEGLEPEQAQGGYTEQLLRLPNLGCYYDPAPVDAVEVDLAALGVRANVPLLICPGSPYKYAPEDDQVLVRIAQRLGEAQFLFFTNPALPALNDKLMARLGAAFQRAGLDAGRYLVAIPWQPRAHFYGILLQADVFLDTIGFSGFNTAMQAIDCALPIVTMEGEFMRGRFASAILRRMGCDALVRHSHDGYVELAVKLAADAAYRLAVRSQLEEQRAVLYRDAAPIRALEHTLAQLCGALPGNPAP